MLESKPIFDVFFCGKGKILVRATAAIWIPAAAVGESSLIRYDLELEYQDLILKMSVASLIVEHLVEFGLVLSCAVCYIQRSALLAWLRLFHGTGIGHHASIHPIRTGCNKFRVNLRVAGAETPR